jgi:hypothetical protein
MRKKTKYKEEGRTYLGFFSSVSQFLLKAMVASSSSCSSCCFCASVNLLEKVDDSAPTITLVGKKELANSRPVISMQFHTYKMTMTRSCGL